MKILLVISLVWFLVSCNSFDFKNDNGLQKSPCACLGIIYDSKLKNV